MALREALPQWIGVRTSWAIAACALAILMAPAIALAVPRSDEIASGQRLFRDGLLADGSSLRGQRQGDNLIEGAAAACVNCHRRSGLGHIEGRTRVPPISAKYLARPRAMDAADMELPRGRDTRVRRWVYSDASLARAVRDGVNPVGQSLSPLMPRYDLPDRDMRGLIAYLRQLGKRPARGVSAAELQFATVITPEADPASSAAMLDVMQKFFALERRQISLSKPALRDSRGITYRSTRKWHLHVWELNGAPDTWRSQLDAHLEAEPVFALLAGMGGRHWAPVHEFCEQREVPCLFPNVDAPLVAEADFYPVYFSRGVFLEADLAMHQLRSAGAAGVGQPGRLVQIVRNDDVGADGAAALDAHARAAAWSVHMLPLLDPSAAALGAALRQVREDDTLMLWLRPDQLKQLPAQPPTKHLMLSGILGGLEVAPLPSTWRELAIETYPFDLPELRSSRTKSALVWFQVQNISLVDERTQVDTYLACVILADMLKNMYGDFVPEYLVERLEAMIGQRLSNAYYPRLGLASGQRFASKGGYLVRWTNGVVVSEGGWLVPEQVATAP